ncbi:hypothetical protein DM01DRAFT_301753 [Hesseltinella vesiculosa]|uniref:Uncharacterized protein n=1 Tax=Hesseltinella vesiculosa TaxID=101127 RepID=A0A1X2G381_9FUNG|nr:hypothetical protein DM01DRAFT_301753 [Hesseltinella vesiculosa]
MSPSATVKPSIDPEDEGNVQTWLKELETAEKLMDDLEAKTSQLDAKLNGLLAELQTTGPSVDTFSNPEGNSSENPS